MTPSPAEAVVAAGSEAVVADFMEAACEVEASTEAASRMPGASMAVVAIASLEGLFHHIPSPVVRAGPDTRVVRSQVARAIPVARSRVIRVMVAATIARVG